MTFPTPRRPGNWSLPAFLSLLLLALASGCAAAAPEPEEVDPAGIYALVSVAGMPVPCELDHGGTKVPIRSGTFTISSDGTCTSVMTVAMPGRPEMPISRKATWTREGATLTMKWEGFGTTSGTLEGSTFSMENEGSLFVYRK